MWKARDIMVEDVVAVPPSTPIIEVAQRMSKSRTGVACICHNGKFRGVITERDLVAGIVASARNPKREYARSLVNNHYPMISPGAELLEAAKVMVDSAAQVLPVVQNGRLLGLVTLDRLIRESPAVAAMVLCNNGRQSGPSVARKAGEGISPHRASPQIGVSKEEVASHER
jgi:CBS domain-containing protein